MTAQEGWDDRAGAFLAFGDTYDAERTDAVSRGWSVTTLPGQHLHMLVDPEGVATALDHLLTSLCPESDRPSDRASGPERQRQRPCGSVVWASEVDPRPRPIGESSGEPLEDQRHALAASDAHRDQADLLVMEVE